MKTPWLLPVLLIPCFGQCEDKPRQRPDFVPADVRLSSHPRAAAAAARVRPTLERDLWEKDMRLGEQVFLRAFKEERVLEIFVKRRAAEKFELYRSYHVAGTSGSLGPKLAEGDGQVPEGFYYTGLNSLNPDSMYHLSFNIGYPNAYDRFHQRTGSHIMIHGNNISIGCLAMTDEKIEEIYTIVDAALRNGQPFVRVHVFPFRMTEERMARATENPNKPFWDNLREGHDLFEKSSIPPEADVEQGRYAFKDAVAGPAGQ
ncbi:murein L,D-transpeptidase [Luteolibacter sp. SL250]|uniref:L,D-transpeptidase family protein n=1 Tax=Luteolibacter sp. SL250 TaxID=2995170 RepID=UPI0022715FE9|nr:murein L,D-transpeptidase family protein [Luteolibacter sp. SL250]WAC20207.1 murein L,D-transpeptidase [Luteolibacter sp. SL250]